MVFTKDASSCDGWMLSVRTGKEKSEPQLTYIFVGISRPASFVAAARWSAAAPLIPAGCCIFLRYLQRDTLENGILPQLCLPTLSRVSWHGNASYPPFDQGRPLIGGIAEGCYFLRTERETCAPPARSHTVRVAFPLSDSYHVLKLLEEGREEGTVAPMVLRFTENVPYIVRIYNPISAQWFYYEAHRLRTERRWIQTDAPNASIIVFYHGEAYCLWSS